MELLIHIAMVICFLFSFSSLIARWTGDGFYILLLKVGGLVGTITPVLYYINYFNLLGTQV